MDFCWFKWLSGDCFLGQEWLSCVYRPLKDSEGLKTKPLPFVCKQLSQTVRSLFILIASVFKFFKLKVNFYQTLFVCINKIIRWISLYIVMSPTNLSKEIIYQLIPGFNLIHSRRKGIFLHPKIMIKNFTCDRNSFSWNNTVLLF